MITSLALSLMVPDAAACGGFFCNNLDPVEQAGEVIVFEVDPLDGPSGTTTMHVQVEYEGPPVEFAWVVPVKGTPDLFVSNDALFTTLERFTAPRFDLWYESEGECAIWNWEFDAMAGGVPGPPAEPDVDDRGVQVLASETVGPYDTVVLAADNETVLIEWLQTNGYNIPSTMGTALSPYVADDHNFVALRLAAGQDSGDLVPLGLRYEGTTPGIPIQLTSVAATDDMQLITYVLGPERAVPDNYLHVELNESAIDWFSGGANYMDVLSRAANQAGGQAFTTEYAGSTSVFDGMFYNSSWSTLGFADATSPSDFVMRVTSSGLPASAALLELLEQHVQVPDGYDAQDYYNCPSCYPELDALITVDYAAAADAIDTTIVQPLEAIDGMFQRAPHITRLGSTMSPSEMTIDPMFTFNGEIPQDISNVHTARIVYQCDEAGDADNAWYTAPKDLVLEDGTAIRIPSSEVLEARGLTDATFVNGLLEPAASSIASIGSAGGFEVLYDGQAEIDDNIDRLNDEADDLERGGCNTARGGMGLWLLALVPLALRRRR
jgi:hypothetical protein